MSKYTCNIVGLAECGLAILIRSKIRPKCDYIFYNDTRIMGIQIKNRDNFLYFALCIKLSTLLMSGSL